MVARGLDHLTHPLWAADIAWVDTQARRTVLRGLNSAAIVEMNISHDGHSHLCHDLFERQGGFLIGARHPHDIDPGGLGAADLRHGGRHVMGQCIGHGLHRDRCVTADRDVADHDLTRLATLNLLIRTVTHREAPKLIQSDIVPKTRRFRKPGGTQVRASGQRRAVWALLGGPQRTCRL